MIPLHDWRWWAAVVLVALGVFTAQHGHAELGAMLGGFAVAVAYVSKPRRPS